MQDRHNKTTQCAIGDTAFAKLVHDVEHKNEAIYRATTNDLRALKDHFICILCNT